MASPQSDRALRKAVYRLRGMPPTDFDSIMASLDDGQRRRIVSLLSELEDSSVTDGEAEAHVGFDPVLLPDGISPWLAARINGRGDEGEETSDRFVMTPHAHAALRRCAAAMVAQPDKVKVSPSLLGRLWGIFA